MKHPNYGPLAVVIGLLLSACGRNESVVSEPSASSSNVADAGKAAVHFTGSLVPAASDMAGHIGELRVGPGERIRKGDIVAVLTAGPGEVQESRQALAEAETTLDAARTEYLKQVQLRETGRPVSPDDEAAARAAMEQASEQRNEALRRVQQVQREDNRRWVRSPADGRVESVLVQSNQAVHAGQDVLTIRSGAVPP
ncbi:MAG: biotin/lipoyl-binding protein [Acidobacteria bacterium]|nr:biotin/lipoyl-binding protein [Acidobacteriota bacterium]